jgi:uncharacterized protein
VKFNINQIPLEGLTLLEEFSPQILDLEIEPIKFHTPVKAKADISKITNVITVHLSLDGRMYSHCSRCLEEFDIELKKDIELNFPVDNKNPVIDLDPDIREEIILDYPIKPLCRTDCKGLCPKCGKNLNEGDCSCGTT